MKERCQQTSYTVNRIEEQMKVMKIGKCTDKSCRGWLVAITTRISAIMWGTCSDCGTEAEVQIA